MAVRPHSLDSLHGAVSRCQGRGLGRLRVCQTQALPAVRLSAQESLRALWCLKRVWVGRAETPFSPEFLGFRWRVEARLQSPLFANSSHGSLTCKACRQVEFGGPCVRFSAGFIGWLRRGLVGCRKCWDTVVRRGCGARF